jgi:hypothetical protein
VNIYTKLAIASAGLALSFSVIEANSVNAATLTYNFSVDVTTGSLADSKYEGSFSYDDSTLTGSGVENVGVEDGLSILFNFLGKTYTEADDNNASFNFPIVEFKNGNLVGLQYIVNDTLNNAIFSIFGDDPEGLGGGDKFHYVDVNSYEVGEGNVTYSLETSPTPIPEPSTALGMTLLGFGWLVKRKIKQDTPGKTEKGSN